jgi:outer membrane protein TolC
MPQLDLLAGYARISEVPVLKVGVPGINEQVIFPNIPNTWRTRAQASLPLYTGGRVGARIEQAGHAHAAARHDVEGGDDALVLETTASYWSFVTAREAERVLREAVRSFEAHLKDANNRLELGLAARNETLAVQVERDRSELRRLEAENSAQLASADLRRLTGLGEAEEIEAVDELSTATAEETEGLATLVAEALAARPELGALRSRLLASEAVERIARSAARPQASLRGSYDLARPNNRILPLVDEWNDTWSVGVDVTLTWDGGRTGAAAAEARSQAEALRHQVEDTERGVRLEVESRRLDLRRSVAAQAVAERNLEAARENERVTRDRYREGVALSVELLDAESALLGAGLDLARAAADARLARARLDRALGR